MKTTELLSLLGQLEGLVPRLQQLRSRKTLGKLTELYFDVRRLEDLTAERRSLARKIRAAMKDAGQGVNVDVTLTFGEREALDGLLDLWREIRAVL